MLIFGLRTSLAVPPIGFQKVTKALQEREFKIKNELEVPLDFITGNE